MDGRNEGQERRGIGLTYGNATTAFHFHSQILQLVEVLTVNQVVPGPNPGLGAILTESWPVWLGRHIWGVEIRGFESLLSDHLVFIRLGTSLSNLGHL